MNYSNNQINLNGNLDPQNADHRLASIAPEEVASDWQSEALDDYWQDKSGEVFEDILEPAGEWDNEPMTEEGEEPEDIYPEDSGLDGYWESETEFSDH